MSALHAQAERHISGMMLMDDTTFGLVQRAQQPSHGPLLSPWHMVMQSHARAVDAAPPPSSAGSVE